MEKAIKTWVNNKNFYWSYIRGNMWGDIILLCS